MTDMKWADIGFRVEITGDGSPSLRLLQSLQEQYAEGEAMHHSGGACIETGLIYGTCIREVFAHTVNPDFIVVGLGLGYIEMFIAREALLLGQSVSSILSFESVPELRQYFWSWLYNQALSPEIEKTYDHVAECVLTGTAITKIQIKKYLKPYFKSVNVIQGALEQNQNYVRTYHGILYDAFSSKTTPNLWEEIFLNNFLEKAADVNCSFATYACKGSLKRALKMQGFALNLQEGFKSKRNRTSASRQKTGSFQSVNLPIIT